MYVNKNKTRFLFNPMFLNKIIKKLTQCPILNSKTLDCRAFRQVFWSH